jgi:hypothetical protein
LVSAPKTFFSKVEIDFYLTEKLAIIQDEKNKLPDRSERTIVDKVPRHPA